jgi:Skp family chaperone for outer membrane proteins
MKYGTMKNNKNGCDSKMIRNEILEHVFQRGLHDLIQNKDKIITDCITLVSSVLDAEQIHGERDDLQKKLTNESARISRLINLRIDGEITKEELQTMREPLDKKITILKERLSQLDKNTEAINERDALLDQIKNRVNSIVYTEVFSEDVAKEMLDKIIVHDKANFDVYFKGDTVNFTLAV